MALTLSLLFQLFRAPSHTTKGEPSSPSLFENLLVGHRGCKNICVGERQIPENSVEAFRWAIENGAHAIELDVQLTSDGQLVVFHDSETDRLLSINRPVQELTVSEIQRHQFSLYEEFSSSSSPSSPPRETLCEKYLPKEDRVIPSLRRILELAKEMKTKVYLESKTIGISDSWRTAQEIVSLVDEMNLHEQVIVISFFPAALYYIRSLNPQIQTCYLIENSLKFKDHAQSSYGTIAGAILGGISSFLYPITSHVTIKFLGASMIGPHYSLVDQDFVDYWTSLGFGIYTWTVNDEDTMNRLRGLKISVGTDDSRLDKGRLAKL